MAKRMRWTLFACSLLLLPACGDDDHTRKATPTVAATATAVPTATATPNPLAQACLDSGGTVGSGLCCLSAGDFPSSCGIGACGCSPAGSHTVARCECPSGTCWNGSTCLAAATPTPPPTPNPLAEACVAAGGTVATRECCTALPDFADACGPVVDCDACLPPDTSPRVFTTCACPSADDCWNGDACVPDLAD